MGFFAIIVLEGQSGPATTPVTVPPKPLSSRQQVALELLQTERNYVEILSNIFKVNNTAPCTIQYKKVF